MPSIGATITANDYNTLQSRASTIMVTDYGQTIASAQVNVNDTVTATQLDNLRDDIERAYTHQQGVAAGLTNVGVGDTILASHLNDYATTMTSVETNKFLIASGQFTTEGGASASNGGGWNGTITHDVTVTFASGTARTQFFNTGGEIRTDAELTGSSGAIYDDWRLMLSNMGVIKMNYDTTTRTGSGTAANIGYNDLTTSYQQIFRKQGSGVYADNDYFVHARLEGAAGIRIRIRFQDDKGGNPDENVPGTLQSNLTILRATGSNVSIPAPTFTNNTSL